MKCECIYYVSNFIGNQKENILIILFSFFHLSCSKILLFNLLPNTIGNNCKKKKTICKNNVAYHKSIITTELWLLKRNHIRVLDILHLKKNGLIC